MFPHLFDKIAATMADQLVEKTQPISDQEGNLYEPQGNDGRVEGRQHGRHFSVTTRSGRHPWLSAGAIATIAGVIGVVVLSLKW